LLESDDRRYDDEVALLLNGEIGLFEIASSFHRESSNRFSG
jgi:hypothetical protein